MAIEVEVLSYRELADRLGVSADAARNRAKRRAQAGLWRIIPGNHPSERVRVEIPAADLAVPRPERSPGSRRVAPPVARAAQRDDALESAYARIDRLTALLIDCETVLRGAREQLDRKNVAIARAWQQLEKVRADAAERIVLAQARSLEAEEALRSGLEQVHAVGLQEAALKAERDQAMRDLAAFRAVAEARRHRRWWARLLG